MNKSERYHVYGRHNKPYRFFFRLLMLYLLLSVAFFMYRDSLGFCTLSDAIIKRDALSLFIVSFMVSSLYFYYHGYCSTSPEHPLPLHHPLHKLQQNSTLFFCTKWSLIPIVFLVVVVFDIESTPTIHYSFMFLYVIITWILLACSSFVLGLLLLLIIIPWSVGLLYYYYRYNMSFDKSNSGTMEKMLAMFEFIYLFYIFSFV